MEYCWGNVADVSSFVLVEATGDSESAAGYSNRAAGDDIDDDDDDAESCICDSYDSGEIMRSGHCGDRNAEVGEEEEEEEEGTNSSSVLRVDGDGDGDDDEEGEVSRSMNIYQKKRSHEQMRMSSCIASTASAPENGRKRHAVIEDSRKEMMNEMERNRLFWEACLAS